MMEGDFSGKGASSELDSFRAMLQAAVEVGRWAPFDWLLDSPWARAAGCADLAEAVAAAVRKGKEPMRDRLLGMRSDWGSFDRVGWLMWQAVEANDKRCVKMLVDAGASIDASSSPGGHPSTSALGCAVENRDVEMAKFLIGLGATARLGGRGVGHLGRAVRKGHVEMVALLISSGCDPDELDGLDETPVSLVNEVGYESEEGTRIRVELVELLARAGADLNRVDFKGDGPLHKGCMGRNWGYVEALLAHGAKPWLKNKNGRDVLDLLLAESKRIGAKRLKPMLAKWADRMEGGDASEAYCVEASQKLKAEGLIVEGGRIAALGEAIAMSSALSKGAGESDPGRAKTLRV